MKTIGILGGMGPLATVVLYNEIVEKTKAESDQEHIHTIIDSNTKIPDRTKSIINSGKNPLSELISSANMLEASGADFIIMPCNTAHYYYDKIAGSISIPLVNMLDETVKFIAGEYGCRKNIGLLATDGTYMTGIYDSYFNKIGSTLIKPVKTQKCVMSFIYEGVKKGKCAERLPDFYEAVDEVRSAGSELILLGCTELSVANYIFKLDGDFIDPMSILADRAIEMAGGIVNA